MFESRPHHQNPKVNHMATIGIDPGKTGALALLVPGLIRVEDMPLLPKPKKGAADIDHNAVAGAILRYRMRGGPATTVYIEDQWARPGDGNTRDLIAHFGTLQGICIGLGIPFEVVSPQKWKKFHGIVAPKPADLLSGDMTLAQAKAKSVALVKTGTRLNAALWYPEVADMLTRVKDNGRADALAIARYGELCQK